MIKFKLEIWDKKTNHYTVLWKGKDIIRAQIMMLKPYNRRLTRRLVSVETRIISQAKAENE